MHLRSLGINALFFITGLVFSPPISGQIEGLVDHDTSYYESYPEDFIGRFYLSRKYTGLELKKGNDPPRLRYRPDNTLNAGLGGTYRKLSLNIAYGLGFLNDEEEKGKSEWLDLQSRIYSRKWAIDLYGQFYKGFYLYPKGRAIADPEKFYIRPDLKINLAGVSAYRLFNHQRFSFRPIYVQDEWQKKSAGSVLAGAELYYGSIKSDSAVVPGELNTFYDQRGIDKVRILQIGPGAGYAYTLVLPLHFYLMGSLVMNLNMSLVQENGPTYKSDHFGVNADMFYRISAGYSNGNWNINVFHNSNKLSAKGALSGNRYVIDTGIYRLIVSRRFHPGIKSKKLLRPIDRIMRNR